MQRKQQFRSPKLARNQQPVPLYAFLSPIDVSEGVLQD